MGSARNAERAFFPLDDELGLLPGALTPSLQEDLVRLGVWMPFRRAAQTLAHFRLVQVSASTAARITEGPERPMLRTKRPRWRASSGNCPAPEQGPAQQFLSVNGAMVPLVGGEWAEVKTLVIGEVQPPVSRKGLREVHTNKHSYFSRLTDAERFQRLALVETQRRGVETARAVVAVTDGAEWIQKFVDHHRHDAVRVLDFPHAAEHINAIGQALWGEGSEPAQRWLAEQLHCLKHSGPGPVLAEIQCRMRQQPANAELTGHAAYLEKRAAHMQYPALQATGWPSGDGAVESGNKLVVEARLKGSGMHWARQHVDSMLALRNIVCSDRWDEAWPQIMQSLRQQARHQRRARHEKRRSSTPPAEPSRPVPGRALEPTAAPGPAARALTPQPSASPPAPAATATTEPRRPAANHPWRRMPIGRAPFQPPQKPC